MNESLGPLPSWVEPGWHTCAVGCLRCQQACPENAVVDLTVAAPEVFDEAGDGRHPPRGAARRVLGRHEREAAPLAVSTTAQGIIARNLRVLIEG